MSSTEAATCQVLYQEAGVVVAFKPNGMPVAPDPTGDPDLLTAVRGMLNLPALELVNRIDRPVSGLVLAATPPALQALNADFRERRVLKRYRAIVEGRPPIGDGALVLTHELTHHSGKRRAVVGASGTRSGPPARSVVRLLQQGDRYALVEVEPEGGAFHQIRAQLSAWGHPIKGDVKYGARRGERGDAGAARSIALHAHHVVFDHPATGSQVSITASRPEGRLWQLLWPAEPATGDPRP
jgi:23S rRNA pseudouridine1911/1915/1917 synthase